METGTFITVAGSVHSTVDRALLEWEVTASAAIVDLLCQLAEAGSLKAGCALVARGLQQHLSCARVAIGIGPLGKCRLQAISGMTDVDLRSPAARELEIALNDPQQCSADSDRAEVSRSEASMGFPLRLSDGRIVGVCLVLGDRAQIRDDAKRRFLSALSQPLAAGLDVFTRAQSWSWASAARRSLAGHSVWRMKRVWAVIGLALCSLMIPFPYRVACECQLEPVVRRYVAAPYDGTFEKSLVKPGALVARDQVLGRMDGREIRWEMAGLTADQGRAGKSRDMNLAGSKVAAAQIDKLEMERIEHERRLLDHRLQHLDIKSPIDGVVISGDLQRSEGIPLTVGQTLYEIAPLDRMVAELAIEDDEISHVSIGQQVSLWIDALPGCRFTGTVTSIHPRSEIRDDRNVFVGEVLLENADGALRPGMKGHAKITSEPHALGWTLFHKPWEYLQTWSW